VLASKSDGVSGTIRLKIHGDVPSTSTHVHTHSRPRVLLSHDLPGCLSILMLLGDTRIMARLQANTAFLPSKFVSVLNRIHEYCTGFGNVTTNGNATTQCFLLQPLADTLHHATSEEQATAYQSVVPDFSGTHCDSSKS